jgi:hypothetical protein
MIRAIGDENVLTTTLLGKEVMKSGEHPRGSGKR